jgi:galactitol-specific phosphotransferase system IIC component
MAFLVIALLVSTQIAPLFTARARALQFQQQAEAISQAWH